MRAVKKYNEGGSPSGRRLRRGAMEVFPALESLGRIRVKVDKDFTPEATGAGSIEYFGPGVKEIPYTTGNVFKNPGSDKKRAILVGPKSADPQTVALDMLHALPEVDSKFDEMLRQFGDSLNQEEIRYWFNDAVENDEWNPEWGGYEKFRQNYIDGKLRNLLFEGTEEDFKRSRYNPTEREEIKEREPAAFEKFQEIQAYLKTPVNTKRIKPIKKYNEGGKSDDWKPENWDSLPENKRRLLRIQHRAEMAFDSGDIEKAKELAAKADKIEKRQAKWKKKIEDFNASQAAKWEKAERSGNAFSSMDDLMMKMQMDAMMNSPQSQGQNTPSSSGGGSAVPTVPITRTKAVSRK